MLGCTAGGLIMAHEWRCGEYLISTDKERLDIATVHNFLTKSYWAAGIPVEIVKRSIEHSLNFGLFQNDQQVGFARVITVLMYPSVENVIDVLPLIFLSY
jgi:hypothetical protein